MQNHAEIFENCFRSVLDPKCAKLDQKSYGNFAERLRTFVNAFLRTNVGFSLQTAFFDGFNVLLNFLAKKLIPNEHEITSTNQFWNRNNFGTETCEIGRKSGLWRLVSVS